MDSRTYPFPRRMVTDQPPAYPAKPNSLRRGSLLGRLLTVSPASFIDTICAVIVIGALISGACFSWNQAQKNDAYYLKQYTPVITFTYGDAR